MNKIDVRCPAGPQKLFMRLVQERRPLHVVEGNLMEIACYDCRVERRKSGEQVVQVLHRYNFVGELIETEVVLTAGGYTVPAKGEVSED